MSVFGDVFTLIGIMAVLVWMDWRLALVAFSVLPLIALITQWFRRNVRESYRTVRIWIARINAYLQERITGMATVQLLSPRGARLRGVRRHRSRSIATPTSSRSSTTRCSIPAIELVSALAASLIIWVGGGWVMSGALTLGSLVAFLQYSQRFFRPISDMSEKFNVLQGAMASSERIFALLDTPVEIQSPGDPRRGGACRPASDAAGQSFASSTSPSAYVRRRARAAGCLFEVEPGPARRDRRRHRLGQDDASSACCCGSTMCRQGRITIDGVDIREMDLAASAQRCSGSCCRTSICSQARSAAM